MVYRHLDSKPTDADASKCEIFFAGKFVPRQAVPPKQTPPPPPPVASSDDQLRLYVNNYGTIDDISSSIIPGQVVAMESKGKVYLIVLKDGAFLQV